MNTSINSSRAKAPYYPPAIAFAFASDKNSNGEISEGIGGGGISGGMGSVAPAGIYEFVLGSYFESHTAPNGAFSVAAAIGFTDPAERIPGRAQQFALSLELPCVTGERATPCAALHLEYDATGMLGRIALAFAGESMQDPEASAKKIRDYLFRVVGTPSLSLDRISDWAGGQLNLPESEAAFACAWYDIRTGKDGVLTETKKSVDIPEFLSDVEDAQNSHPCTYATAYITSVADQVICLVTLTYATEAGEPAGE